MNYMQIQEEFERRFLLQEEYLGSDKPVNRIVPLVSITIITYQHKLFIAQCIESALAQETNFPYEIIIGEDGSTDGTREICIEYAEKYPDKIRLFLRDRRLTALELPDKVLLFNGNFCRKSTRGKYFALLDGDDYWIDNRKIEKQVDFLETNNDFSLCFTDGYILDELRGKATYPMYKVLPKSEYSTADVIRVRPGQTCTLMFRSTAVLPPPVWVFGLVHGDVVLKILAAQYGKVGFIPDKTGVYRIHDGGFYSGKVDQRLSIYRSLESYTRTRDNIDQKYAKYFSSRLYGLHMLAARLEAEAKQYINARQQFIKAVRVLPLAAFRQPGSTFRTAISIYTPFLFGLLLKARQRLPKRSEKASATTLNH